MTIVGRTGMGERQELHPGDFFHAAWPFMRDEEAIKTNRDWVRENGPLVKTDGAPDTFMPIWKMGTEFAEDGCEPGPYCDAMGSAEFLVVCVCELPGRYQPRVFYKRTLIDPDGRRWGGKDLKVATIGRFLKWTEGWRPEIVVAEEYGGGEATGLRLAAS